MIRELPSKATVYRTIPSTDRPSASVIERRIEGSDQPKPIKSCLKSARDVTVSDGASPLIHDEKCDVDTKCYSNRCRPIKIDGKYTPLTKAKSSNER
jgi:hypothetical protein